jgi:hypothetical protein
MAGFASMVAGTMPVSEFFAPRITTKADAFPALTGTNRLLGQEQDAVGGVAGEERETHSAGHSPSPTT